MKAVIVLLTLLNSFLIASQELKYFESSPKFDWEAHGFKPVSQSDLEKLTFLKEQYDFIYSEHWEKSIDSFHAKDIDQDGWVDIVYMGWNGGEGEMLLILKNDQGDFTITQSFTGTIVEWKDSNQGPAFKLLDYGCCGGWVDHLVTVNYSKEKQQFQIVDDIANMVVVDSTLNYMDPIRFEIINNKYNLRYAPEIETGIHKDDTPFDVIDGQNISAVYAKGDRGTALASQIDSTGRVWWLVVMDNAPMGESLFYKGNDEYANYRPVSWMSSRYVRRIESQWYGGLKSYLDMIPSVKLPLHFVCENGFDAAKVDYDHAIIKEFKPDGAIVIGKLYQTNTEAAIIYGYAADLFYPIISIIDSSGDEKESIQLFDLRDCVGDEGYSATTTGTITKDYVLDTKTVTYRWENGEESSKRDSVVRQETRFIK